MKRTEMSRGKPLKATKPIAPMSAKKLAEFAKLGVRPASTLDKPGEKRKPMAKRWTDTGPDDETVEQVRARDLFRCVSCGDPCPGRRGMEWSISHRKLRAQGVDNRPANLMLSCGNGSWGCEAEYHRGPERARQHGFMLLSTEDPETVAVEHSQHGLVYLLNDGSVRRAESESAE